LITNGRIPEMTEETDYDMEKFIKKFQGDVVRLETVSPKMEDATTREKIGIFYNAYHSYQLARFTHYLAYATIVLAGAAVLQTISDVWGSKVAQNIIVDGARVLMVVIIFVVVGLIFWDILKSAFYFFRKPNKRSIIKQKLLSLLFWRRHSQSKKAEPSEVKHTEGAIETDGNGVSFSFKKAFARFTRFLAFITIFLAFMAYLGTILNANVSIGDYLPIILLPGTLAGLVHAEMQENRAMGGRSTPPHNKEILSKTYRDFLRSTILFTLLFFLWRLSFLLPNSWDSMGLILDWTYIIAFIVLGAILALLTILAAYLFIRAVWAYFQYLFYVE